MDKIKLTKNRSIGEGEYPFIVAEIGNNHNGDADLAKKMVAIAKDIGVDAVKFQKKNIETAFSPDQLDSPYIGPNSFGTTYREHKEALELSEEELEGIYDYCRKIGIICFTTPFDTLSVDCLEKIGNPIYKISSFHVTDHELITSVSKKGKPIFMSTGMSTIEEVDQSVNLIRENNDQLALLHCVSAYPTEDQDIHLRVIPFLKDRYQCPVGYSGHERGVVICVASVPLGACIIERHFTLDRTMKGPDHASSVEPAGMKLIVNRSKYIHVAMGNAEKRVLDCERNNRKKFRGY